MQAALSTEFDPGRPNEMVRAQVLPLLESRDSSLWKLLPHLPRSLLCSCAERIWSSGAGRGSF